MPYPNFYARITSFQRDENIGLTAPSPSGVDSELNALAVPLNALNLGFRRITTPDGYLKNLAVATAQALAGTEDIVATASQTDFVTTIPWTSSFTTSNVFVFISGLKITVSAVADDGNGFLQVTIAAQDVGTVVTIAAFESGAGLLTKLQTSGPTTGANLMAIEDAGGYTTQVTTEAAIQELYEHTQDASGKTWLEGVLVMSNYLAKAGGTMDSGADITMQGGGTVKGLPASSANGEAVRHEQIVAVTTSITGLSSSFMPKSGGTFSGTVSMDNNVLEGVPTPTASDQAVPKSYVDSELASFGGLPVGTLIDFGGSSAPTGWLVCDGSAVSRTTYANLFAVIGVSWGVGDAATTFNLPDFRGRVAVGSGTGSGLTARTLGATGGEEDHVLLESEMPSHTHTYNWGQRNPGAASNGPGTDAAYTASDIRASTTTSVTGTDIAHNNMQPYAVTTKLIKV